MRITLDIDDVVLLAAKELARRRNLSTGQVVSELLRQAIIGQMVGDKNQQSEGMQQPNVAGFRPFMTGNAIVTNDIVNRLREAEGI